MSAAELADIAAYSSYVYSLADRHEFVTGSTLSLASIGATLAKLEGQVECSNGIRLEVFETALNDVRLAMACRLVRSSGRAST